jgi:hypothetical protein
MGEAGVGVGSLAGKMTAGGLAEHPEGDGQDRPRHYERDRSTGKYAEADDG